MRSPHRHPQYKVVNFVDVNEFLTFAKNEEKQLEKQIKDEERIEQELRHFIHDVEKHSGHTIHHIGSERRNGVFLVRFLFREGGFLEVLAEKPVTINGHFLDKKHALKFASGLKKALHRALPDTPVKDMVLDSVSVDDGYRGESVSFGKWSAMHKIAIHKTAIVTVVAAFIFFSMEVTKELTLHFSSEVFEMHSFIVSMFAAVFLAFLFEPLKEKIEHFVERFF